MADATVLLSIPGLRRQDLVHMPRLASLAGPHPVATLVPSFPCVTCPVQATMTTGKLPQEHGVVANGFFYRDRGEVEMWTAWNDCIRAPQIWDLLHQRDPRLTSAVWFPLHSKGATADYICTPAPIHNPDGSESLWCYTKPTELYGELRDALGHFPLMNFWGPLAGIKATDWIVDSAVLAARRFQPRFSYIYLPHLDYAAQKFGPDTPQAVNALVELDQAVGRLIDGFNQAGLGTLRWLAASEYVITAVDQVAYPNRLLREAGLLALRDHEGRELLVPGESRAWALVDHQLAHVFVNDPNDVEQVAELFRRDPLVEQVLVGDERARYALDHERSGEVILIARPHAWFAYYWWLEDHRAPAFARTVDIHRKPGYDPVELFINLGDKTTPLDATLVKGSHGYPATDDSRCGVLIASEPLRERRYRDVDIAPLVLEGFAAGE